MYQLKIRKNVDPDNHRVPPATLLISLNQISIIVLYTVSHKCYTPRYTIMYYKYYTRKPSIVYLFCIIIIENVIFPITKLFVSHCSTI
jgi:hypothetical protein